MNKRKLREYSSFDLLNIAIEAVEKDVKDNEKFKNYFNVDFTFLQLCSLLTKRKIWYKRVITKEEYGIIESQTNKESLIYLLKEIKERNSVTLRNFNK